MVSGDRPQDVGRSHKRGRAPDPEAEAVLERYRAAMRAELDDTLAEIRPATGQLGFDGAVERPSLERRRALWDLAVKLGRELGNAPLDAGWTGEPAEPGIVSPLRDARAPKRFRQAERKQLGG